MWGRLFNSGLTRGETLIRRGILFETLRIAGLYVYRKLLDMRPDPLGGRGGAYLDSALVWTRAFIIFFMNFDDYSSIFDQFFMLFLQKRDSKLI